MNIAENPALKVGNANASPKYRRIDFPVNKVHLVDGKDGVQYVTATMPLGDYAARMTDKLVHWARETPNRTFIAQRARNSDGSTGDWRHITYADAMNAARSIGQALLDRKLDADRPVIIVSDNDIEHALIGLGCLYAGIPYCPVSPAYSTISKDFEKLRHIVATLTPGLVFASDASRYGAAIAAAIPADVEVVIHRGTHDKLDGRKIVSYDELRATQATPEVDAAADAITPDTITKFLFTSGSTKLPKAVVNTHRMWCANQQQMRQSMPVLADEPPVLVDWLPWNHTFGGNHNVGITLYNGGTLYIDDGKPTPALIGETFRNLREIAPTVYFNVPTGFEAIANQMKIDEVLRKKLLSRVRMFFYAGAALAQPVWDALHETQEAEIGERIVMGTGLGMTESSPFAIFITNPAVRAGDLGVPAPGLALKLVPSDGKIEVRYSGPNITPGYWRSPEANAEAFDDEGFFSTGDAVKWIDENDIHKGLKFDGRIAEDFKLATGTFVSVGPMRAKIIAAGAPYVQDVVITGINRKEVGALIFPTAAVRALSGLGKEASLQDVVESAPVQQRMQQLIDDLALTSTGSASHVALLHVMHEAASIDKGEVTDKGSVNQRSVLKHRDDLVTALHEGSLPFTLRPSENKKKSAS